jgi:DNA-binding CsgD family transcriptional regulator
LSVPTLEGVGRDRWLGLAAEIDVPAHLIGIYQLADGPSGMRYTGVHAAGDADAVASMLRVEGLAFLGPWDPVRIPARAVDRFLPGIDGWGDLDRLQDLEVWRTHYGPQGLRWERRMLVYHERQFVAWVGVSRRLDGRPFRPEETRRLHRATPRLRRLALAVRASEPREGGPAHAVFSPTGDVAHACARAAAWLDAGALRLLGDATRRLDRGEDVPLAHLGRVRATPVRMAGVGPTAYLWTLVADPAPSRSPAADLAPRTRAVAELAAAGAQAAEIAKHLGMAPETARTHLRTAYAALQVASRVELAEVLGRG